MTAPLTEEQMAELETLLATVKFEGEARFFYKKLCERLPALLAMARSALTSYADGMRRAAEICDCHAAAEEQSRKREQALQIRGHQAEPSYYLWARQAHESSAAAIRAEIPADRKEEQPRDCTCHPGDNPPQPCAQKHAYSECVEAASQTIPASTLKAGQTFEMSSTEGIKMEEDDAGPWMLRHREQNFATHFNWCSPGDDQKQRWILRFEDQDVSDAVFENEDEARAAFLQANDNWTCHLFCTALAHRAASLADKIEKIRAMRDEARRCANDPTRTYLGRPNGEGKLLYSPKSSPSSKVIRHERVERRLVKDPD